MWVDWDLPHAWSFKRAGTCTIPSSLSFLEASTLTCAEVTAWSALFGLSDYRVTAGKRALTQGTGGVGVFALQFARAVGARVIATTGSSEEVEPLKDLGADNVMTYKGNAEWGIPAKAGTLKAGDQPGFPDAERTDALYGRSPLGSETLLEDLCRAFEANLEKLRPVIDPRAFWLDQLKEAREYQWSGQHKGKVCIEIS
ncbi:hypothetical protein CCMA1212_010512 [Trichoderma ghanense]|uniref:Alcohol dehydrogenase-like C-terminal domain-containing protein n=1 Tax=Trichoderma ghanense TaxID=65468 RepID=A0ABY2GS22_9HYPO